MELHDDDAEHFEFALRLMYTQDYDQVAIEKLELAKDEIGLAAFPLGIHTIADKYDIKCLIRPAIDDLYGTLRTPLATVFWSPSSRCTTSLALGPGLR
jgi:hypothetical protein